MDLALKIYKFMNVHKRRLWIYFYQFFNLFGFKLTSPCHRAWYKILSDNKWQHLKAIKKTFL